MAVAEAIKEYIAKNYGDGTCITGDTGDNLGTACMTDALVTPLPTGYTSDDICTEEVITWAYDNVGWCITAAVGYLSVDSSPTGASVTADGVDCGTTPVTKYELSTGSYTVTISKAGYQDETRSVTITEGDTTDLGTITLTEAVGVGYIYVGTFPPGASYWIDKDPETEPADGLTPSSAEYKTVEVSLGKHTLHYRKDGYKPVDLTDTLTTEDPWFDDSRQALVATEEIDSGTLKVTSYKDEAPEEEVDAIVEIDSTPLGFTPVETRVETGTYDLSVSAPDRKTATKSVTIKKDETTEVKVYLKEKKLRIKVKITPGKSWVEATNLEEYPDVNMWYIGEYIDDKWVRVHVVRHRKFKCILSFTQWEEDVPIEEQKEAPLPPMETEEKELDPYDSASDRHLDIKPYTVPDKPGDYGLLSTLQHWEPEE